MEMTASCGSARSARSRVPAGAPGPSHAHTHSVPSLAADTILAPPPTAERGTASAMTASGGVAAQRRARRFIRHRRAARVQQRSGGDGEHAAARAGGAAQRHNLQQPVAGAKLRGGVARLRDRHLQHQGAAVVRDAA